MKKLFQNRAVAWIVLILAVALACLWGYNRKDHYESRKTTELLEVKYYQWVNDSAKLLSDATEKTVADYDTDWNNKYYTVVAVATLNKLNGWTEADYARALGEKWGLGGGDMLLLLVKGDDWYVAVGDNVAAVMTDTQQTKLKQAIDQPYYAGKYDEAVVAFFRQADVFYAQAKLNGGGSQQSGPSQEWEEYSKPKQAGSVSLFKVALLVIAVLVVWAILDRFRYNRYQRRYRVASPVTPVVAYYPIFWGRTRAPAAPRPVQPAAPANTYHRPASAPKPSGSYRTPSSPKTPPNSGNTRPGNFGKSGFGGGKR
jgi:uncharacterized membrane protein YgcG